MIGVMLVNQDFVTAFDGAILRGPASDKRWLANFVKNKRAIVGSKTYEADLIHMPKFVASMKNLIVIGRKYTPLEYVDLSKVDLCLGGATLIDTIRPETLILHQIYEDRIALNAPKVILNVKPYKYESIKEFEAYSEIILRRRNAE